MWTFFIFITAYASSDSDDYDEEETYGYKDDDVMDPDWCLDDPDGPLGENATETVDEQLWVETVLQFIVRTAPMIWIVMIAWVK